MAYKTLLLEDLQSPLVKGKLQVISLVQVMIQWPKIKNSHYSLTILLNLWNLVLRNLVKLWADILLWLIHLAELWLHRSHPKGITFQFATELVQISLLVLKDSTSILIQEQSSTRMWMILVPNLTLLVMKTLNQLMNKKNMKPWWLL